MLFSSLLKHSLRGIAALLYVTLLLGLLCMELQRLGKDLGDVSAANFSTAAKNCVISSIPYLCRLESKKY